MSGEMPMLRLSFAVCIPLTCIAIAGYSANDHLVVYFVQSKGGVTSLKTTQSRRPLGF